MWHRFGRTHQRSGRMRSSFVRKTASSVDSGTRSGLHGQTLMSMGLVDLDRLLGGGLPLGSLLLVMEVKGAGRNAWHS